MEKIKSVLHGHKKSEDATHDVQASSTGAHSTGTRQDATTHPIYDEMTGKESTHPTTGTTTSAGQTGTTKGLAQDENHGTEGPFGTHGTSAGQTSTTSPGHTDQITSAGPNITGSHGASTADSVRPGAGGGHDGISTASIKSGVIGFGSTGKAQEHAALSPHQKLESQLDHNQVVGGGIPATGGNTATGLTVTSTSDKDGLPLPVTSTQPHSNTSNIAPLGTTRQESYTKDTDRSFPLAGGVASKHGTSAAHPTGQQGLTTQNPVQETSSTHHTAPLVGGVASKNEPSATHPTEQHDLTSSAHPATSEREPGTKEKGVGVQEGHGREGLAGAAAAATALGVASHSHHKDSQPQGHATQPVGASMQDPKNGSTNHPATGHHPDALAAATAAAAKFSNTHGTGVGAQDNSLTGTTQSHATGVLPGERPAGTRSASHRHIPGEFPSPTPDESKTFLYYRDDVVPEPGATTAGTATSTAGPHSSDALNKGDPRVDSDLDGSKTAGTAPLISGTGQHELRHTGSLDQPQSRSEDHHHGRDAAVAGGLAAGAAGLAYGAHQKRDASDAHGSILPHEPSPYSSKQLDPRVSGGKVPLEQQRFDPQAKAESHQTSSSVGVVPSTSGTHGLTRDETSTTPHSATTKQADSKSHHGRDAALLAGGAGTAAGIHHATKDNRHGDAVGSNTMAGPHTTTGSQIASSTHTTNASNHPETTKHEESKNHHGRDAALLGGGAATAAGVHHATKKDHASDAVESDKVTTGPQHKSSLLNKLDPRVKSDKSKTSTDTAEAPSVPVAAKHDEPKTHHGRDAALVAGGAATAVGAHKASQRDNLSRNDTPGTGTYVLSQQGSTTSVPFDGATSTDPHSAPHTSAPLAASTTSGSNHSSRLIDPSTGKNAGGHKTYSGPLTTDGTPFYGAVGAPAPVVDNKHGKPEVVSSTGDQDREHHYGRDAALVGAGAATAGGLAHGARHDKKSDAVPTQSDSTHHSVGSTTAPTAAGMHQSDPTHKDHHLGRDAAIAGGTGAAGYGAYEAAKTYGDHRSTQPGASMNEQRYDTTASGATTANPVPASGHYDYNDQNTSRNAGLGSGAALGAGILGGAAYADSKHHDGQHVPAASSQPLSSSTNQGFVTGTHPTDTLGQKSRDPNATTEHSDHTGRNVALGGAALGTGALGGAAYAGHKHDNAQSATGPLNQSLASPQQGTIAPQNTQSSVPGVSHNRYDSIVGPNQKDDHTKRDAALIGTAGAATAGGVAYGYSQHHDNDEEKHLQKEQHKLDKEHAKQEKAAHKHEKEAEKESSEPEKKHGILGFLHRDKTKKEKTSADTSPRHSSEVRRSSDGLRHSSDDPDSPRWKAKSKLHKDPPKGHPAREALDHHEMGEMGGKREHVGIDGPIGDQERISGFHNTAAAKPLSEVLGTGSASEGYRGVDQGGMGTGYTGDVKRGAPY